MNVGPRRIVSLNPCLDAILVQVADRAQIAAISRYSRDPATSSLPEAFRGLPITYGTAEEVMALKPDLVLADRFAAQSTLAAFRRLRLPVAVFDYPATIEASLAQVMQVATAVGRPDRGHTLVARIRSALAAAAPPPGVRRPAALVFQAGGQAVARGTMLDELLARAGFDNAATRYGLARTGLVPLERLVADPPELLLASRPRPGAPSWADRVIVHPALARVAGRMRRVDFPARLTFCGGPVLIEAAAALAAARRAVVGA